MSSPTPFFYKSLEDIAKFLESDDDESIPTAGNDGRIESPPPMDTISVNASTGESQHGLTNEVTDQQLSEASAILMQMATSSPEQQNMDTSSNTSTGESQINTEAEDFELSKVATVLTEMVKKGAARLRQMCATEVVEAAPVSYRTDESDERHVVLKWEEGQSLFPSASEMKRKVQCDSMGELDMSFELPNYYDRARNYLNQMKTPVAGVEPNQYNEKTCQFSFDERSQGWKLECKSRCNGRVDMYYHHKMAKKTFRSMKEAVNFMMYESYPKHQSTENGYSKDQTISSSQSKKFKFGSMGTTDHGEELKQLDVVKFFEDAYNNLLNYDV